MLEQVTMQQPPMLFGEAAQSQHKEWKENPICHYSEFIADFLSTSSTASKFSAQEQDEKRVWLMSYELLNLDCSEGRQ